VHFCITFYVFPLTYSILHSSSYILHPLTAHSEPLFAARSLSTHIVLELSHFTSSLRTEFLRCALKDVKLRSSIHITFSLLHLTSSQNWVSSLRSERRGGRSSLFHFTSYISPPTGISYPAPGFQPLTQAILLLQHPGRHGLFGSCSSNSRPGCNTALGPWHL
jgi:hypothetical protein